MPDLPYQKITNVGGGSAKATVQGKGEFACLQKYLDLSL